MSFRNIVLIALASIALSPLRGQTSLPADKPHSVTQTSERDQLLKALEPCVKKARETYPTARKRFLSGLEGKAFLSITVRLVDAEGRIEQAFVTVDSIDGSTITGKIASEITTAKGKWKLGDRFTAQEEDIVDWTISHPESGTEEGNLLGKYIEFLQKGEAPPSCDPEGV